MTNPQPTTEASAFQSRMSVSNTAQTWLHPGFNVCRHEEDHSLSFLIAVLLAGCSAAEKGSTPRTAPRRIGKWQQRFGKEPSSFGLRAVQCASDRVRGPVGQIWKERRPRRTFSGRVLDCPHGGCASISGTPQIYGKWTATPGSLWPTTSSLIAARKSKYRRPKLPSHCQPSLLNCMTLKDHPLWRVMFIGEGHDDQSRQTYFVVYPDVVRIEQLSGQKPSEAVKENATMRLRFIEERKTHLKQAKC